MAAYREGLRLVLLPEENRADLEEIDADVRRALTFVPVADAAKVLDLALVPEQQQGSEEPQTPPVYSGEPHSRCAVIPQ